MLLTSSQLRQVIKERAYAIWEREGRPDGKDPDHWLRAEAEIIIYPRTSHENFVDKCPWCHTESIFNRISDLHTTEPIMGRSVRCLNIECGKTF